jgi:squalene-associated FAD-dependent desaturase
VDRDAHALATTLNRPRIGSLAVIGAGWAGLAAAVQAVEQGHRVTLYEMASHPGGRARAVMHGDVPLDNGQHILIGAYRETLALMRKIGADPEALLERRPLALVDPKGRGLSMPTGAPVPAFVRAALNLHWSWRERGALLAAALRWRLAGFNAPSGQTVAMLAHDLPRRVRTELIDPLCVAALNTPAELASAQVFLTVLRDALFGGAGSSDLLLPRATLSALLPEPAARWLAARGARLQWGHRVRQIEPGWRVDGEAFDAVLLACSATEAARLAAPFAPAWAAQAVAFEYEPIVTVYLQSARSRWSQPMVMLPSDGTRPAQFAFDLGALDASGRRDGLFAFVVSGARGWVERGVQVCAEAVIRQANEAFPPGTWVAAPTVTRALTEKRATFFCVPDLQRPPSWLAHGLAVAGDYVQGPYPATLEGAVRSGTASLRALQQSTG